LSAVEHRIGIDAQGGEDFERARRPLVDIRREALVARAERLDELVKTFPQHQVEAARRADRLTRLCDEQREAHEHIGRELARLHRLGPLSRIFGRHEREFTEHALASWTDRAQDYDEQVAELTQRVDADRHERATWFQDHGEEFIELSAAKVELHDRDRQARARRINDIRRDPPAWVTEGVGPRPDHPAAREHWDRAAAHLDDYRHAFGPPPDAEPPSLDDYRQSHAWDDVQKDAAKALESHPERPLVERSAPQLDHDIGLGLGH
jgi:hypothetical protein